MSDDSRAERNALRTTWPTSKLLLCQFHILMNEWKWLMSNEAKDLRQGLMQNFKKVKIKN
jgi:hypothetical protein